MPKRFLSLRLDSSWPIFLQEDKQGKRDAGPKSWGSGSASEDSGWKAYILPIILALLASIIYRIYFA
jgi:hypothetical protein